MTAAGNWPVEVALFWPTLEPIRTYVGLQGADTLEERAQLALPRLVEKPTRARREMAGQDDRPGNPYELRGG